MGRLIDADVLIERIYEYQSKVIDTDDVIHSIKTMHTAYDVEKVVADLKRQSRIMMPVIPTEEAIDIVKRGGAE